ncbi:MAG: amino acid permease [Fimbriimonadaceae bacterium]|nr:amino acid permease [Fimbriimonadaceae bacterium]RIJ98795.1 MAG: hypothetical protein DCC46_11065 [Armatimonadota bacterium]WKZ81105.1 MAG: amino acid permease [Fimbriimonadaceae bacterium]
MTDSSAEPKGGPGLERAIGLGTAIALIVGSTIGSGIFRSPAEIARLVPGPLPMLGIWVLGGLFAMSGALTLAEVASAYPRTGGIYVFLREAYGRVAAFSFGWTQLLMVRAASLGAVATAFVEYSFRAFGNDPKAPANEFRVHLLAAVAILVVGGINYLGVRWGSATQNLTTIGKVSGLLFVVALAFLLGLPGTGGHFAPAAPPESLIAAAIGLAVIKVLWAYDGWADLSYVSGELDRPARNVPRAFILGNLAIITVYLLANVGYLSVFSVQEIAQSDLIAADVANALVGHWGVILVSATVMVSTFGTLNGSMFTSPRIFYAMAKDRLLPRALAGVSSRFHTPSASILLTTLLGVGFVLNYKFEDLADIAVIALVPFYMMAVGSVFLLRKKEGYSPSFRLPLYPLTPLLFVLGSCAILYNSLAEPESQKGTLAVIGIAALGVPVYWLVQKLQRPAE